MVIGILYDEDLPNPEETYEGVRIEGVVFYTGDVVKDWEDALRPFRFSDIVIICSSSVDHFLMDTEAFYFDENDLIKRLTKESG